MRYTRVYLGLQKDKQTKLLFMPIFRSSLPVLSACLFACFYWPFCHHNSRVKHAKFPLDSPILESQKLGSRAHFLLFVCTARTPLLRASLWISHLRFEEAHAGNPVSGIRNSKSSSEQTLWIHSNWRVPLAHLPRQQVEGKGKYKARVMTN